MRNIVKFKKYHTRDNYITRSITSTDHKITCPQMEHGHIWEATARVKFVEHMKQTHNNLTVTEVGMFIDDTHPYVSASPDGIVKCDCHGVSILEIKCTWKHWKSSLVTLLSDDSYHFTKEGNLTEGKRNKKHCLLCLVSTLYRVTVTYYRPHLQVRYHPTHSVQQ